METKKIMIVDDEEDVRLFLSDFLAEREFWVDTAGSGEEALEKLAKQSVDIILLDIMMPGMDGLECLDKIKQKYHKTTVIMITALKDEVKMARAKKSGAYDYIVKPFSLSYLETELTKLLETT